jgi:hypothetical protein
LIDEAAGRASHVVDVTVAIAVATLVDPAQRPFHVAAQLVEQRQVARPARILGEQDEEERRRVHRTVIGCVRDLTPPSELAEAKLM